MAEKKSFLMYTSYLDNVTMLSDEEAGKLLKAIYAFVNGDDIPELDRVIQITFNPIRSHLERDMEKYKDICRKRKECGAMGGRPPKQKPAEETKSFSEKPKKPDNEKENENVNANVNVNVNANEKVYEKSDESLRLKKLSLTQTEYKELCDKFGKADTDRYLNIIERYKTVAPEKYTNTFGILNRWMDVSIFG